MDVDKIEDGPHCHVTESNGKIEITGERQDQKCINIDVVKSPIPKKQEGDEGEIHRHQKSKKMLTLLALLLVHFLGLMDL